MRLEFTSNKLKRNCENFESLKASYGKDSARKIFQRMQELEAADSLKELPINASAHKLIGDKKGQFAVDIKQPFRIIFEPIDDFDIEDIGSIKAVRILELSENYH